MQLYTSYQAAFRASMDTQSIAIAHLHRLKPGMNIDTSGCYKLFFPLSGEKKFHVDNKIYDVKENDLFLINPREWHYFSHFDPEAEHERFVLFLYPEYVRSASTEKTDLTACFSHHLLKLTPGEKERFLYYIQKLSLPEQYGSDLLDHALSLELLVFLNRLVQKQDETDTAPVNALNLHNKTVAQILSYVDTHISEDLSIQRLAEHFFMSTSHLCKTFKNTTGTTIHKYITAQRITLAKDYLSQGHPTIEVGAMCGYHDYNAFLKAFTKEVGISPKKYAQFSV